MAEAMRVMLLKLGKRIDFGKMLEFVVDYREIKNFFERSMNRYTFANREVGHRSLVEARFALV